MTIPTNTVALEDSLNIATEQPKPKSLVPEITHRYFKAITPELNVNTKARFDKNNIEWIEDITYANTPNKGYFLKIPVEQTAIPPGCKKMYFIPQYPGPNEEYISGDDAAMFYSLVYPRYRHVAKHLIDNNGELKKWSALTEQHRQHFTKVWGAEILQNSIALLTWKATPPKNSYGTNKSTVRESLKPRPKTLCSIEDEHIEWFTLDEPNRVSILISCNNSYLDLLVANIAFENPEAYVHPDAITELDDDVSNDN